MKLSIRLTALALSLIMLFTLCGCGEGKNTLENIQKQGKIVFGVTPDYLPMSAETEDGAMGMSIDIGNEIAARLDVEAEYIFISQENAAQYLNNKVIDCYINLAGPDIRTVAQLEIVDTGYDYKQVVAVPVWSTVTRLVDLTGERVCVISGTDADTAFREAPAFHSAMSEIAYVDTYLDVLYELTGSTCAAAIVDEPQLLYAIGDSREKFIIIDAPLATGDFVFAFRYRDSEISGRIQNIYGDMKADGSLERIRSEWL